MNNHENSLGILRKMKDKKLAFTLTEVLLAISIVGVIAALVIPMVVVNYQNKALNLGYKRIINTIQEALRNSVINENKDSFKSTVMYMEEPPSDESEYENTSGKFIKKYLRVNKYCGTTNRADCFADKYYEYTSDHKKVEVTPTFNGTCAILKDGASICLLPQIGTMEARGIIDINGKKGPNVYCGDNATGDTKGCDLKVFYLNTQDITASSQISRNGQDDYINNPPEEPSITPGSNDPDCSRSGYTKECCDRISVLQGSPCCTHYADVPGHPCYVAPPPNPCATDNNSRECCLTRKIESYDGKVDVCCAHPEVKNNPENLEACTTSVDIVYGCDPPPEYVEYIKDYRDNPPYPKEFTNRCWIKKEPDLQIPKNYYLLIQYCDPSKADTNYTFDYNGFCYEAKQIFVHHNGRMQVIPHYLYKSLRYGQDYLFKTPTMKRTLVDGSTSYQSFHMYLQVLDDPRAASHPEEFFEEPYNTITGYNGLRVNFNQKGDKLWPSTKAYSAVGATVRYRGR